MPFRRDEGHAEADSAPGEHDSGNPFRGRELSGEQGTRDFQEQVAGEKDASAETVDFRRQPGQGLGHGQFGVGNIDAVDAGYNRDEKDR